MAINTVSQHFPSPIQQDTYINVTAAALQKLGFNAENTLPILAICRDEICASFIRIAENQWGNSFTLGGLGGLPFGGKTGMGAASHHAPDIFDRKRFIIYAMAHIGYGPQGEVGGCVRPGMKELSGACGALIAFTKQLAENNVDMSSHSDDAEFDLLKNRMSSAIPQGAPDLLAVTNAALAVIKQDITSLAESVLDTKDTDYAVFTGTQIHLPDQNLVQASDSWVVINGTKQEISFKA